MNTIQTVSQRKAPGKTNAVLSQLAKLKKGKTEAMREFLVHEQKRLMNLKLKDISEFYLTDKEKESLSEDELKIRRMDIIDEIDEVETQDTEENYIYEQWVIYGYRIGMEAMQKVILEQTEKD